jgi:hypothetical protein
MKSEVIQLEELSHPNDNVSRGADEVRVALEKMSKLCEVSPDKIRVSRAPEAISPTREVRS